MAHRKKKLSLSERFGTIGSGTDFHNKARNNSEMVSKLQKQITEVVRKRTGEYDRESQAKMISEEISDIQQRFDDVPVASQKFKPFKVELKVNISNKNAEQQINMNRNETACNARNLNESYIPPSCKADQKEKRQEDGIGFSSKYISDSECNLMKDCQSKSNERSMTATGSIKDELNVKIILQETSGKCESDERGAIIPPLPEVYLKTSPSDSLQSCDSEFNSQNTAKLMPAFQEEQEVNLSKSQDHKQNPQSWKKTSNADNYTETNSDKQEADFNKTNSDDQLFNINNDCAQSSQKNRTGSEASPDFKKKQVYKKTSPNFKNGKYLKTSPNVDRGQASKTSPNVNRGHTSKTSPNVDRGHASKTSPNVNRGHTSKTSPNVNRGHTSKTSPNVNRGHASKTSPNVNRGHTSKTSPNVDRGQSLKTSPNFNKGIGIQNFNTDQDCMASPNMNKEKGFQTSLDLNKNNNALVSENFSKGQGSKNSPSFSNAPNFCRRRNNIQTNPNMRQCSDASPYPNKGQEFQPSSNITREKGFKGSPNFNQTVGFQTSPNFKRNVPKSFGPGKLQDTETNVQRNHASTFSTDDSHAIYDTQDQFYNHQRGNWLPKGRQKRVHFQNKTGFGGHPMNQQGPYTSNSIRHYHGNQPRQRNPETSYKHEQPVGCSPSKQLDNTGGFGKRHASPLPSNQYMAPAKKRVLNSDPLNKDVPSFQNRLSYAEKNMPPNPPWQGKQYATSGNAYAGNCNHPYGYYPGHVGPNAPPQPSVAGNYGLALHGPFTPKTWNMSDQKFTPAYESTNIHTLDNTFHNLNETSSTKQYLFSKMLGQNDAMKPAGDLLKHTEDAVKPFGVNMKSAVKPTGDVLKPTGFYQEIANETSGTGQNEKEETELVSTLLTQCQAMAQKDDDRQALNTIFNIIHQEMGHQTLQTSVKNNISSTDHMPEQTRSTSDAYGDDARFSPTSSSPDAASKLGGNIRFEGRTLLKGGVKPRHIPKTLVNKQDDDPPRDPRPEKDGKSKPLQARKMKDLPLPPFFIEFVATEKFGKKRIEGKPNQVIEGNAEKSMNAVSNSCILSSEFETKDLKIDFGKVDSLNIVSNNGIEQQQTAHGGLISDTKPQDCDADRLERRKTEVISPILPLITVRREPGLNVKDNACVDVCPRDPRLRATSISKKRENNPIVDLPVIRYEEYSVEKPEPPDNGREKGQECVPEPKNALCGDFKGQDEAYLLTNVNRDGPRSLQRNSSPFYRDTNKRETSIPRSVCERNSHHSDRKDSAKQFSENLPTQQRRYSGSYSTKEVDRFSGSPSRRCSRFSTERSLSRSRSSSRSRDEEWTEKEVAVRRTDRVNFSHGNVHQSHSYERETLVYKDRHGECYENQFHERHEYDRRNSERRSMSPGTCRYLKRRDFERKNTPPSSINRNVYRNRYHGSRNRNYSEGSDYPESCSSPLR